MKFLKEVGAKANKENVDSMMNALKGKKLHELVAAGSKKLASMPTGGKFKLKMSIICVLICI